MSQNKPPQQKPQPINLDQLYAQFQQGQLQAGNTFQQGQLQSSNVIEIFRNELISREQALIQARNRIVELEKLLEKSTPKQAEALPDISGTVEETITKKKK
jgi:hypothetical protein